MFLTLSVSKISGERSFCYLKGTMAIFGLAILSIKNNTVQSMDKY